MARQVSHALLRTLSALLACLLGLFCARKDSPGPQPVYGVASAEYHVNGVVRAKASQAALPGIEVTLRDTVGTQLTSNGLSDSLGRYQVAISFGPPELALRVTASDVDGATNGAFVASDTVLRFAEADLSGGTVSRTVDLELDSAQ
jgi:putative lipoprotein (rSAM/lipoprotein system)